VTNGNSNVATFLAYSVTGQGSTFVPMLNVTVDLASPKKGAGRTISDPSGNVVWTRPIPNVSGVPVWLQAVQYGQASNLIATSIQ